MQTLIFFLLNFNIYTFYEKRRFIIRWIFEAIQNRRRPLWFFSPTTKARIRENARRWIRRPCYSCVGGGGGNPPNDNPPGTCELICIGEYFALNQELCQCDKLPRPWYYDGDGDEWHDGILGIRTQIESPGTGWRKTTKGVDCDDKNILINKNCYKDYFIDNDGDGYDGGTISAKDQGQYKTTTLGADCDDSNASVYKNNKCGKCEVEPVGGKCPCKTSAADLKLMFPSLTDAKATQLADVLNKYAGQFGIDSKEKLQHFLAQVKNETENLTKFTEDLDYKTTERLGVVFYKFSPKNPNKIDGTPYLNNPMKLANLVYSYRFTNGSEASGDGWEYRGRGFIHLTGKEDYIKYKNYLASIGLQNLYNQPDDLNVSPNDVLSALWYFKDRVLSKKKYKWKYFSWWNNKDC